jgi:hypothetical protein
MKRCPALTELRLWYRIIPAERAGKLVRTMWHMTEDAARQRDSRRCARPEYRHLLRLHSLMMNRSDRRPENLIKHEGGNRSRLTSEDRACGFHQGQSKELLANRPDIVTQSDLPSSSPITLRNNRGQTAIFGG